MKVLREHPSLWLVNLGGWLAVGALAVGWFWIPDSSAAGVIWSAAQLLAVAGGLLWLPAATLHYLAAAQTGPPLTWREAAARGVKQTPRLALWAAPACALAWWLGGRAPAWISAPAMLGVILPSVLFAVLPGRLREKGARQARAAAPGILGALAAWALWSWKPGVTGLAWETGSLALRAGLAFVIAAAGWLMAAARAAAPPAADSAESN